MRRRRAAAAGLAWIAAGALAGWVVQAQQHASPRRVAWQTIDLSTGRVLDTHDRDLLSRAVTPGSLMKLPALIALLESGTASASTRIDCPGSAVVGGRRIACAHAPRGHPLSAVEALALSCNVFFARASARLTRQALDDVLHAFGWPAVPETRPLTLAATGIEGTPVLPARLLGAWRQLLIDPPGVSLRSPTRKVVRDALAAAAHDGTAAAFRARGIEALAKTGTSVTSGGRSMGLVLAGWPAGRPARAALVIVEGGAGGDAAAIAATLARGERPAVPAPHGPPAARALPSAPRAAPDRTAPAGGTQPRPAAPAPAPAPAASGPGQAAPAGEPAGTVINVGTPMAGGAYTVHPLALEEYVARVLAGEAAPRTAPAALEALAITARTFALANRRRHGRDGFDLCDSTHCQVLRGVYAAARAAADGTAGQVLSWQGAPASVFYTASCGGRTERPSAVWPGAADPPFLPSRRDRGCGGEPKWTAEITESDLQRALQAAGYRGQLRKVKVRARARSGRVAVLSIDGMTPGRVSGQDLRMIVGRTLGWRLLKSTAFDLSHHRDVYRFKGHGYGHGVGFCVIGSMRRAAGGESRGSLLKAYFPGVQVTDYRVLRLPAAGVTPPSEAAPALASGEADGP